MDEPDIDVQARLERIEAQLQTIQDRVQAPPKAEGGIGCLGIILFLVLFSKLDEVLELVRGLAG